MTDDGSSFLQACRREPVSRTPVWFMRQAGRSLPEYRELRGQGSILEAVRDPEIAIEATCQPVRRYGVDAAILFSDIMVPLAATGFGVEIEPGKGPIVREPIRTSSDLRRLRPFDPSEAPYLTETVRGVVNEVDVPLIGFAGAPFTLASYLVEGGPSRDHVRTKALMHTDEKTWFVLCDYLAETTVTALRSQIAAGASAIQLFDSWSGSLSPSDYERFALPSTKRIFEEIASLGVPRIIFGVGTGELLELMATSGAEVIGVDWRIPLDRAAARVGREIALQGNLDPALCVAGYEPAATAARLVLEAGKKAAAHIFNLGHGVFPETNPEVLRGLVELVHSASVDERLGDR